MRFLVLLAAAGLGWAADATAPAELEGAKPEPAFPTVTIANNVARAIISTQRGSLVAFELLDTHPIQLPKPLLHKAGQTSNEDKDAPLAVLGSFARLERQSAENRQNWLNNSYGLQGTADMPWTIAKQSPTRAELIFSSNRGQHYSLIYEMDAAAPSVSVTLNVHNSSDKDLVFEPRLVPLNGVHQDYPPGEKGYYLTALFHQGGEAGSLSYQSFPTPEKSVTLGSNGDYVGLKSRFFAALFTPGKLLVGRHVTQSPALAAPAANEGPGEQNAPRPAANKAGPAGWRADVTGFTGENAAQQARVQVTFDEVTLGPSEDLTQDWKLTITSMKRASLNLLSETEKRVEYTDAYYKFFKILVKVMTWCLDLVVQVVRSYGVALIIMTFLIKLALHKTTFKQQESMMKMQKLSPQLKLLQETHKNDRQKLAMEQMALFKKHGVHPLGGCLPILIQIPIFIALYQTFNHSADMRGHGFLWVNDLTLPDTLIGFPIAWLSWLTINPLPLIYIGVTIWMSLNQKMPPNADPQQEQMAKMMRWLPVIFGVIFYNMPSGLVLYFTANAIISTIEIRMVKKKLGIP